MNETSLNESPITGHDPAVTATLSHVSSLVDRYSLQVAGREYVSLVLRDSLSGLVEVDFLVAPDEQILLATGLLLQAHGQVGPTGRANQ